MFEGRPFSLLPTPDRELTEYQETARRLRMRELDALAKRLEDNDPGSTERAQRERERWLVSNLRQIENEQEVRDPQGA
jgi:hypothetical protein